MAIKRTAPKPPAQPAADDLRENFIAAAATAPAVEKKPEYPWTNAADVPFTLNTRIPYRLSAKLDWLKKHHDIAKSTAVEEALSAWLRAELSRRGIPEEDQ